MVKPSDTLLLAKFAYPELKWSAHPDGRIATNLGMPFSIKDPRDRTAVIMKLTQLGYTIKSVTRSGKELWIAETQDAANMAGKIGPHELEHLLVVLVRGMEGK